MEWSDLTADACIRTALNRVMTPSSREMHKTLELVAQNYPQGIQKEIDRLNGIIRLLQEYLPAPPARGGE
ncbi:hypothetical protein IHQ56_14255 [Methylobacillus flagellatus]|uniref:hypothetical protein n=1 Tax=Methylobacillus flagellatus TaxID=405 RepID=UPI002853A191|nr:hypothetical protein [Methylobacillus flagellatus]MDR5172971.1 hypothetical protein [Methylobacillus flagellatus]